MSGVVVTCCTAAISRPAKSPARRPTDKIRVSIVPALVAGKAEAVTRVVRGVVDDLGIGKAGQESQPEAQDQGDTCRAEGFASFGRPDDGCGRVSHIDSPWLPHRQLEYTT